MSEHTDAARLEALRDSMRPRVEGEAIAAWAAEDWGQAPPDLAHNRVLAIGVQAINERNELARRVLALTAEVARLRDLVGEAYQEASASEGRCPWELSESFAALALPTTAPEATDG